MSLELIAATTWFWIFSTGFIASIILTIAFLFCSTFWWLTILYLVWIFYDRNISERGGRPIEWVRKWTWWRLMKSYFNHKLTTVPNVKLDESKNYIFACFPHGIFPVGTFASFVDGYQDLFPKHQVFWTSLGIQFWMPVIRELFLSAGSVSVSGPSIKYLLKNQNGGNIVSILIGGGDEAKYSQPGKYKIILNKRKGFVKLALQYGAPLVPVLSFGETDVFQQLNFPGFDFIKNIVKSISSVVLVLPLGDFLVCPYKVPIVTVVGAPIEVTKKENPTNEEIEELHGQFVQSIQKLFEDNKEKYVKNPEKTTLEIV